MIKRRLCVPGSGSHRGMTLIEVLVAMTILAFISIAVFSAIDGLRRSRQGLERVTDRYREGRLAMARLTRELQSAYLSGHVPIDPNLQVVQTIFQGEADSPASILTFNSFAGRRYRPDERRSDQLEITYFGSEDPD
ncbi:MAG: prepilin-type N-terminal cleavage/methylation domain-containing protein, partial [Polyangiaceae bacterium]|nr:prepilin-type N-terminal cleavage/methylation domain-containing protein [Polyangiaceae bacterium]